MDPFNRTSMESKLYIEIHTGTETELLIEPVWNRNLTFPSGCYQVVTLLIEPVWNRNVGNFHRRAWQGHSF